MLSAKITFENDALARCRHYCSTHRIGNFIRPIAAEFQFDRKKLTIFVMKSGDASVCKLVRKLFDSFKIRISILDIESPELARHYAMKYLNLSGINLPLETVYMDPSIIPYVPPTQQLGKSKAASLHQSLSQYSAESMNRRSSEYDAYHSSGSGYYPAIVPTGGYPSDPRYQNKRFPGTEGNYQSADYRYPIAPSLSATPTTAPSAGFLRPGVVTYPPASSSPSLGGDGYSLGNYLPEDFLPRDKDPPSALHYTLAEHQELSKYYRGPDNYSQPSPPFREYSSRLVSTVEEDRYGKYFREADAPHSSGFESSPRDLEPFLSSATITTRQNHFTDTQRFPSNEISSAAYGEYLPSSANRNHEIAEKFDQKFIYSHQHHSTTVRSTTASIPLYRTAIAHPPPPLNQQRYSPSSMNRSSQVTYPIADQDDYLSYHLSESHRFRDNEDSVSTRSLVSFKSSENYELQLDTVPLSLPISLPLPLPSAHTSQQPSYDEGHDTSSRVAVHANYQNKTNANSVKSNNFHEEETSDSLSARSRLNIPLSSSFSSGATTPAATPSSTTSSSFTSSSF
jgi:hypothetical protein